MRDFCLYKATCILQPLSGNDPRTSKDDLVNVTLTVFSTAVCQGKGMCRFLTPCRMEKIVFSLK
jgi:hypothetical protein